MANKYDLKTWNGIALASGGAGATGTNIGGAAVATGKNRFLTYIRVSRAKMDTCSLCTAAGLQIGSVTTSAPSATSVLGGIKAKIGMPQRSGATALAFTEADIVQEIEGTIERPILSVGGGAWMGIALSGATVDVHAQYYDE